LVKKSVVKALEKQDTSQTLVSDPAQPTAKPSEFPRLVREIMEGSREGEHIGGRTVVLDVWREDSVDEVPISRITSLFEVVTRRDALVNLAIDGSVRIHDVRLATLENQSFQVTILAENTTSVALRAYIPKGQIFENKRPGEKRQNLAAATELVSVLLPPRERLNIRVNALCINEKWRPPNGGRGNITVFRIASDSFQSQQELWDLIKASVD
jgi:hypothetical protein